MRKQFWTEAAGSRLRCYAFHPPWPGLGHIVAENGGYRWWQERWTWEH